MGYRIGGIWRYPVKSMQGETLSEAVVGASGIEGDRAFALIDAGDNKVASAKHPRKWGLLLHWRARTISAGLVEITLPDGTTVRSDDPAVDQMLSRAVGRAVRLVAVPPAGSVFEEVWPDIEGLAPDEVITATNIGTEESGERISQFAVGMAAPAGTFFDVAPLHLVTTATLDRLSRLNPASSFDARRYRPNFLIEADGGPAFPENDWAGRSLVGSAGAGMKISMPTMRCVMTTLAQPGLANDRDTLRTVAAHNRIGIPGLGTWACAGAYADVVGEGRLALGEELELN
ncbi:MAG: MOSC domain-containing protein [Acidimicrobiales bacterium]